MVLVCSLFVWFNGTFRSSDTTSTTGSDETHLKHAINKTNKSTTLITLGPAHNEFG